MTPAVYLDRDGTILEDVRSTTIGSTARAVSHGALMVRCVLNRAGFLVVIVTNQAGVARGIIDESFVQEARQFIRQVVPTGAVPGGMRPTIVRI